LNLTGKLLRLALAVSPLGAGEMLLGMLNGMNLERMEFALLEIFYDSLSNMKMHL
jgi:hypothetical protein